MDIVAFKRSVLLYAAEHLALVDHAALMRHLFVKPQSPETQHMEIRHAHKQDIRTALFYEAYHLCQVAFKLLFRAFAQDIVAAVAEDDKSGPLF